MCVTQELVAHTQTHSLATQSSSLPHSPSLSLSLPPSDPSANFSVSSFMHTDSEAPAFMALHNAPSLPDWTQKPKRSKEGRWGGCDPERCRKKGEVPMMTFSLANINLIDLPFWEASVFLFAAALLLLTMSN